MSSWMAAQALRSLADRVEAGEVKAFMYEWDGSTSITAHETVVPTPPLNFIKVTFHLEEGESEPQLDSDQR